MRHGTIGGTGTNGMTESTYHALTDELDRQFVALVAYLKAKIDSEDWHAVQDAASDIREVEAKLEILADLVETQA